MLIKEFANPANEKQGAAALTNRKQENFDQFTPITQCSGNINVFAFDHLNHLKTCRDPYLGLDIPCDPVPFTKS